MVADRLTSARKDALIPRAVLARRVGILPERLASYENARAPLLFGIGVLICKELDVRPRWLALGEKPQFGFVEPASTVGIEGGILNTLRFSDGILRDQEVMEAAVMRHNGGDLSTEERAVGRRVATIGNLLEIPTSTLARIAELQPEALQGVFKGSIPLSLAAGEAICHFLGVSQLWLALGEMPIGGKQDLPDGVYSGDSGVTFYQAIKTYAGEIRAQKPSSPVRSNSPRFDAKESLDPFLSDLAASHRSFFEEIPPSLYGHYVNDLAEMERQFLKKHRVAIHEWCQLMFGQPPWPTCPPLPKRKR